jgi:hypothetical protein
LIVAAVYPAAQFFAEAEALEEDFEELLGELADFEPHPASENTSTTATDTNVNTFFMKTTFYHHPWCNQSDTPHHDKLPERSFRVSTDFFDIPLT